MAHFSWKGAARTLIWGRTDGCCGLRTTRRRGGSCRLCSTRTYYELCTEYQYLSEASSPGKTTFHLPPWYPARYPRFVIDIACTETLLQTRLFTQHEVRMVYQQNQRPPNGYRP